MRLKQLEIGCFRGIRDIFLDRLEDVNLILGGNDAGKTSVLEAIMLFNEPEDIGRIIQTSMMHLPMYLNWEAHTNLETFLYLFPFTEKPQKNFRLEAQDQAGAHKLEVSGSLVETFRQPPAVPAPKRLLAFQGTLCYDSRTYSIEIPEDYVYSFPAQRTSGQIIYLPPWQHFNGTQSADAYRTKQQEETVVQLLQLIDPGIEGIKLQQNPFSGGISQVIEHKQFGDIPLFVYGDGMKKILTLAGSVVAASDGILLIDEIDTSLQASLLAEVFSWLVEACRERQVQLYITTHSLEAISTLSACVTERPDISLSCYRLEKYENTHTVRRFSESALNELVNRSGMDVR